MNHNCIFCQIIKGSKPAKIIDQNERVTVILDINPVADGHLLIIPNEHIEKLHDVQNAETVAALMTAMIEAANKLIDAGICTDYSIVQANGVYAEQSIEHLHFHIIPRHENDGVIFKLDTDQNAALNHILETTRTRLSF